jgi:hypothetical protein
MAWAGTVGTVCACVWLCGKGQGEGGTAITRLSVPKHAFAIVMPTLPHVPPHIVAVSLVFEGIVFSHVVGYFGLQCTPTHSTMKPGHARRCTARYPDRLCAELPAQAIGWQTQPCSWLCIVWLLNDGGALSSCVRAAPPPILAASRVLVAQGYPTSYSLLASAAPCALSHDMCMCTSTFLGMAWHGMAWHGLVWVGLPLVVLGLVWVGVPLVVVGLGCHWLLLGWCAGTVTPWTPLQT